MPEPIETSSPRRIGLVAGGGQFPFVVARAARARGLEVVCLGIRHEVSPALAGEVDVFATTGLGRFCFVRRFFLRNGVKDISWAGWIRKETLFSPWRIFAHLPDWRAIRFWLFRLRNRQSQTLLSALAEEFEAEGFRIAHSAQYCPEILVKEGVLSRKKPSKKQLADIRFGWKMAKRMADLDVGQSVAVVDQATIAVEGMEGTDRNIERAGELCKGRGFTLVKLAKEGHDMRFDVPTIGPRTIDALHAAGGSVLAVEAGKTLILQEEVVIQKANRWGIVLVALRDAPAEDAG